MAIERRGHTQMIRASALAAREKCALASNPRLRAAETDSGGIYPT